MVRANYSPFLVDKQRNMLSDSRVIEAAQQSLFVGLAKSSQLMHQMLAASDPTKAPTIFPMLFNISQTSSQEWQERFFVVTAFGTPIPSTAKLI